MTQCPCRFVLHEVVMTVLLGLHPQKPELVIFYPILMWSGGIIKIYQQVHKLPYPLMNFNTIFRTHLTVLVLSIKGYYYKDLPSVTGR